jgi:hypothetical protein
MYQFRYVIRQFPLRQPPLWEFLPISGQPYSRKGKYAPCAPRTMNLFPLLALGLGIVGRGGRRSLGHGGKTGGMVRIFRRI